MHGNSRGLMKRLLEQHAYPAMGKGVIDVGSRDHNGSYRNLIERAKFDNYTGLDIAAGKNVDVVVPEDAPWTGVAPAEVVISGQCLEHVKRPWDWMKHVASLVKPDGLLIVIAPWIWHIHRHPIDCWRILPDGMDALFESVRLTKIDSGIDENDCYGVARKVG